MPRPARLTREEITRRRRAIARVRAEGGTIADAEKRLGLSAGTLSSWFMAKHAWDLRPTTKDRAPRRHPLHGLKYGERLKPPRDSKEGTT